MRAVTASKRVMLELGWTPARARGRGPGDEPFAFEVTHVSELADPDALRTKGHL
jgi:hypothetical protein